MNSDVKSKLLNRKYLLWIWIAFSLMSLAISVLCKDGNLFAATGAIGTTLGVLLNIKYTLLTYSQKSEETLYANKIGGAFGFSSGELTDEQRLELKDMISDEKYGLSFMLVGTLLWAYGSYLTLGILKFL